MVTLEGMQIGRFLYGYTDLKHSYVCHSAAIHGLRNKANISIFILHPKGRVSPIQEAQMTTVTNANVHNVAVLAQTVYYFLS